MILLLLYKCKEINRVETPIKFDFNYIFTENMINDQPITVENDLIISGVSIPTYNDIRIIIYYYIFILHVIPR